MEVLVATKGSFTVRFHTDMTDIVDGMFLTGDDMG